MKKDSPAALFNRVAKFYDFIDRFTVGRRNYTRAKRILREKMDLSNVRVLDIGCGTGSWSQAFLPEAQSVLAIDFAQEILKEAKRKYQGCQICFEKMDALQMQALPRASYEVVTASFVLHGLKSTQRLQLLKQMKDLSRQYVILYDFGGSIPPIPTLLERLEKSDYRHFIKHFHEEFIQVFPKGEKIDLRQGASIYFTKEVHR